MGSMRRARCVPTWRMEPPTVLDRLRGLLMRTLGRLTFHLYFLTASLVLVPTTTAAENAVAGTDVFLPTISKGQWVRVGNDQLSLKVEDVPLSELLDEIARQSGLTLVRHVEPNHRVSLEMHHVSLEQVLWRLLRQQSFVLEYNTAAQPTALWIWPQGQESYGVPHPGVDPTSAETFPTEAPTEVLRLQVTLSNGDPGEREQAAAELEEMGNAAAVVPLTLALADRHQDVRAAVVSALAEIGGDDAVQALWIALRDEDPRIREAAVDALGEIGGEVAIALLEQALVDHVRFVRLAAGEVLNKLRAASPTNTSVGQRSQPHNDPP